MNNKTHYEVIVIGVGSMGSSACYHLAKRGARVLGLEQFDIPHDQGSHAGQSRIIRKAYFEHPDYVPLLEKAYQNWYALEALTGSEIFVKTGLLYIGDPDHEVMKGVKSSAEQYKIHIEHTNANEYPQLNLPEGNELLFEPEAGFVTPERAVELHTAWAIKYGASIKTRQKVLHWEEKAEGITVVTPEATYHSQKLVITAGPWAGKLIPKISSTLKVTRQAVAWVIPEDEDAFALGKFPCWVLAEQGLPGVYYGFPMLPPGKFDGPVGFKLAHHAPADTTDPDAVDRRIHQSDVEPLLQVLVKYFRKGYTITQEVKTCLYTNTPDEHFIIDQLPGSSNVSIAAGFSGHGFKFASAVGEILADLALNGRTDHPIGFLSADRWL